MNAPSERLDHDAIGAAIQDNGDPSLEDRAYEALLTWLVQGRVKAGDPLPLREFARQMGMSRTPLRAAVGRLQAQGVVASHPRLGFTVAAPTVTDLHELFDLRLMCERHALQRFLAGPNPALPAAIAGLADETKTLADRIVEEPDLITAFYELDFRFHRELLALGGNRRLCEWYDRLGFNIHIVRAGIATPITRDRFSTSAADHLGMVAAIVGGHAADALALLERHITDARDQTIGRVLGHREHEPIAAPSGWLERIARPSGAAATPDGASPEPGTRSSP
jgi:DNA-binding GntR family transcriptional regulator